jgi:hypothetical protein
VEPVVLPDVELAVATHTGEHDDIDVTYGALGRVRHRPPARRRRTRP